MPSIREKLAEKRTKLAGARERISDHPADVNHYAEGSLYNVPVQIIRPNPAQPRQYFDEESLGELADSIRQKGVLQPILVRREDDGTIFLVAGERRLRAAKRAGLEVIPSILTRGSPAEIALIENLQREDLKPVEEAEALARMMEEFGYTQEQLARAIGKARSTITETLSLARLPEAVKEECRRADIFPRRLLVEIAKQGTPEKMVALFRTAKEGGLKSDQVREITRRPSFGARRAPFSLALGRMAQVAGILKNIDPETLSPKDREALARGLESLRAAIKETLRTLRI